MAEPQLTPDEFNSVVSAVTNAFGDTATQYPHVVCALDRGMIRGMLAGLHGETPVKFETSRPDGGDHCVARV